ncbi:hypothetical protein [Nibricoccus sp. IMCC34717]|uniref:hypothetical protein n=1 Tax=Nibricoccus sp. IMCC34717 TaxID=3034021 RepID=UPI00384B1169
MSVDRVIVMCWKRDFHFARLCLTSIRYFYPKIPLHLIKDTGAGDFDTRELERRIGVKTEGLAAPYRSPFGKLTPLFDERFGRYLFVDADQLMIGPVLDRLGGCTEDFIVSMDPPLNDSRRVAELYFDSEVVRKMDPSFSPPGWYFNSGQFVATAGKLTRADFEPFLPWRLPLRLVAKTFPFLDQSVVNYVFPKAAQEGRITLGRCEFSELARTPYFWNVSIESIRKRNANPILVHWAGQPRTFFPLMRRGDLFAFFEREYYRGLKGGPLIRLGRALGRSPRNAWQYAHHHAGMMKRRLRETGKS